MSNALVGQVYASIIDEVVNSSRVDFEENGVDESALEELRLGWQSKLSQIDVASFPWDPKPAEIVQPPAAAAAPPPAADTPTHGHQILESTLALPAASSGGNGPENDPKQPLAIKQEPNIKQEPGVPQTTVPLPQFNGVDNKNSIAASRAAQQLAAQYGNRAAGSINAIRGGLYQQPGQGQEQEQSLDQTGFDANGQMDGAGEDDGENDSFEGVLLHRASGGDVRELGRVEIDQMLHNQILANAKAMEGGGLMLPLKEATRHPTARRADRKGKGKAVANYDGEDDDDDEFDEDAINSDLDDPEEDRVDDDEGDEGLGHIMLCMYDKVQRVKNKWKCILKDGVLTVNGKEYVFHKATGEFEW